MTNNNNRNQNQNAKSTDSNLDLLARCSAQNCKRVEAGQEQTIYKKQHHSMLQITTRGEKRSTTSSPMSSSSSVASRSLEHALLGACAAPRVRFFSFPYFSLNAFSNSCAPAGFSIAARLTRVTLPPYDPQEAFLPSVALHVHGLFASVNFVTLII